MTTITIDKNVPVPKSVAGRHSKYPWDALEINDSFFIADRTTKKFASTVYGVSKRTGKKFTCRAVDGGVRVWRLA